MFNTREEERRCDVGSLFDHSRFIYVLGHVGDSLGRCLWYGRWYVLGLLLSSLVGNLLVSRHFLSIVWALADWLEGYVWKQNVTELASLCDHSQDRTGLSGVYGWTWNAITHLVFKCFSFFLFILEYYPYHHRAGVVSTWWFNPDDAGSCCSVAIRSSCIRASTTSFGSICFGSILVAFIQTPRAILQR